MAEDWPSPHHHESHPLPRIEDLPAAWEGYDRERVQAAFDTFYRHIAQLDATLRTLESVEVFRDQAGDLRAELRSLRAAGWAPYPRGYTLTPERSMLGSVPEAASRIALEVVFLVIVAAVVAVAKLSALEIVGVMAGAVLITFLVELIAARERRATTPIPAAPAVAQAPARPRAVEVVQAERAAVAPEPSPADEAPAPAPAVGAAEKAQTPTDELSLVPVQPEDEEEGEHEEAAADDGSGWAAFAEPAGPQPLMLMGALGLDAEPVQEDEPPVQEDQPSAEEPPAVAVAAAPVLEPEPELEPELSLQPEPEPELEREPEPEPEPEPSLEPAADVTEAETGTIARRRRFRRRKRDEQPHEVEPQPAPKHVRVLPARETAVAEAELPPWERGFDDTEERR